MGNKGWTEYDNHEDPSGGPHSTGHGKTYTGIVEAICSPTTVAEQAAACGWAHSERPVGIDDSGPLTKSRGPAVNAK